MPSENVQAQSEFSASATGTATGTSSATAFAAMEAVIGQVPPEFRANYEIWLEIRDETDRGAAILALAYLESLLEEVIRSRFYRNGKTADRLFTGAGALVPLDAKCRLGYCIGLYGLTVAIDIGHLGTIRNRFAHRKTLLRFRDDTISVLCAKISGTYETYFEVNPEDPARNRYIGAVQGISFILGAELTRSDRPKPLPPLFGK